jgi:hypothetical protein
VLRGLCPLTRYACAKLFVDYDSQCLTVHNWLPAAVLHTWRRFLCAGSAGTRFRPGGIVSTTSADVTRQAEVSRPKVGTGINLPWNGFLR